MNKEAIAIYYRQKLRIEYKADSLEDACYFLAIGSEHDELAPDSIFYEEAFIKDDELEDLLKPFRDEYNAMW